MLDVNKIYCMDVLEGLKLLDDESVDCVVTSPPYWGLRSYLPNNVQLKKDIPKWVLNELKERNICPINHIGDND